MKKIKYDMDVLENKVKLWEETRDEVMDLRNHFNDMLDLIHKMDINPAGDKIKDNIENLEQSLVYDHLDNIEDFIDTMKNNNEIIIGTDDDMTTIIGGR